VTVQPRLQPRESFGYQVDHLSRLLGAPIRGRVKVHGIVMV
jgi:hypothetical protein